MTNEQVIVVGGGIAGLTASALLAHEGFNVILLESHYQTGGCAGTFKRGNYVFDVGATQIAGLEKGGIHERLFRYLDWPQPLGSILDPGCEVDLRDGSRPIKIWHDPVRWEIERNQQFPGSKRFWSLCSLIHQSNWSFAEKDTVLPVSDFWDFKQFISSVEPLTFLFGLLSRSSVSDLLWLCSCPQDQRLQKFLDLQLQLYSQEKADQTAALYGATVLQMAQAPRGLWHLQGSMKSLSDALESCLLRDGGKLLLRHKVTAIETISTTDSWIVDVVDGNGSTSQLVASDLVFTLPPQCLLGLTSGNSSLPTNYRDRIAKLPQPNGAIVFYGAISRQYLQEIHSNHYQFFVEDLGSLFLSISCEGDGRAPLGEATIIASAFTSVDFWASLDDQIYRKEKQVFLQKILKAIKSVFNIHPDDWLHKELATPRSFAKWTGRPQGIVGGLGQRPTTFGPFGLSSRSPVKGLWLCGDSIYPGEGTAGVSQSALMACRQLMATKGHPFRLPK